MKSKNPGLKYGVIEILNPPYPYKIVGIG